MESREKEQQLRIKVLQSKADNIQNFLKSVIEEEVEWYVVKDNILNKLDMMRIDFQAMEKKNLMYHTLYLESHLETYITIELLQYIYLQIGEIKKALKGKEYDLNTYDHEGKFKLNVSEFLQGRSLVVYE